jgi:uncharacterized protein YodC (DUF2158 family)
LGLWIKRGELDMADIKAGDIVKLKSGGPTMTVEKIDMWNGALRARCSWFNGSDNKYDFPSVVALKLAEGQS